MEEYIVHLIENFPAKEGWYLPHPETGVPQSEEIEQSINARYLTRVDKSYVGPLVRGSLDVILRKYGVDAGVYWSGVRGVALF